MNKVSIIGSGNVGANTAFFIAEKGITDVSLFDINEGISTGKALDMMEAAPIRKYRSNITGIDDIDDISGSGAVVIAAGSTCALGGKNEDLLGENWKTVSSIMEKVINITPDSIIITATEPVDILTTLIVRKFGLAREKVIGLGGIVDSARFRSAVSRELSISAENISTMVIGRHDVDMIVLPKYTSVSGIPLIQLMDEDKIEYLMKETAEGAYLMEELAECPGSYYTPSAAAAEVIDSVHMDLKRILPVSIVLDGEYGINGVALSLPCVTGSNGAERIMTPSLTEARMQSLTDSGRSIDEIVKGLIS